MEYKKIIYFLLTKLLNIKWYLNIFYSSVLKFTFKKAGMDFRFDSLGSTIINPFNIEIGNNVFIGEGAYITIHNLLKIGDGVMIGPHVTIIGGDHNISVKVLRCLRSKMVGLICPL